MKLILIDNDEKALASLEDKLKLLNNTIVGKFTDPLEGAKRVSQGDVDLVFMEISMAEINGIVLARMLMKENPNIRIVFVTNRKDYGMEAFKIKALDYILKPATEERLMCVFKKVKRQGEN